MLNTIRYRLLAWFILFMLLTVGLLVPFHLIFRHKEKKIAQVYFELNALQIDFLKDDRLINDFLTTEPDNSDFFTSGKNSFLIEHAEISGSLNSRLSEFSLSDEANTFGIKSDIEVISRKYADYNSMFDSLVYLVYKRGYRNFGLRGELADYADQLQNISGIANSDIWLLREIQNEYFTNRDTASLALFKKLIKDINDNTKAGSMISAAGKDLLNNYLEAFLRLIDLDNKTGILRNKSLRASLNVTATAIEEILSELNFKTQHARELLMQRLKLLYFLSLFFILALAIYFSYRASRHIVSHLEALTNYISSLSNNEHAGPSIDLKNSTREIRQIYREFRQLFSQLKIWEKQRNSALQNADDNQQRYRELADLLPQSVFETDSYGNYTYVNKAWYQSFGYTPRELSEGLNLIETLVSETGSEDILGINKIENCTFLAVRKNGSRFPASVYTDNIISKGKINGRRGIIIDITERVNYIRTLQQETSRAKTSDELKSSFLANMSHEIRTPMNSIIGFSNLLASEQIPETQKKDFTHYIQTSSELLLNLVDDIIDIAKIEAGELKIVKKECKLGELGNELLTTSAETKKRFNKLHLQLSFTADPVNPEVIIKTDPFRLKQILVNLISNAIKFTDKGSVDFGYSIKDDSLVEFYVKDTGPGLSREDLDLIFERFRRTKRSDEKNIAGTGLGLAISKNLVQLLGGEMWVDSVAGSGTTFRFTLPYLRITSIPSGAEEIYHSSEFYNWKDKKILIVEDDINSCRFLTELLRKTGIDIILANNGMAAVEMFRNDPSVDIVLMDIQLPVMDGLQATRLIKEIRNDVPVIAQTAHAMAGDKDKMRLAGCDDYISKPLNSIHLHAVINHFLLNTGSHTNQKTGTPSAIITDRRHF